MPTLVIEVKPELLTRLQADARQEGVSVEELASRIVAAKTAELVEYATDEEVREALKASKAEYHELYQRLAK